MNDKLFKNNNKTYLHDLGTSMTTKEAINSNIGANISHNMLINVFVYFTTEYSSSGKSTMSN